MVIQSNMSPKAIVEVWQTLRKVFEKYNVQLSDQALQSLFHGEFLTMLLKELNEEVGSSSLTCIEGG